MFRSQFILNFIFRVGKEKIHRNEKTSIYLKNESWRYKEKVNKNQCFTYQPDSKGVMVGFNVVLLILEASKVCWLLSNCFQVRCQEHHSLLVISVFTDWACSVHQLDSAVLRYNGPSFVKHQMLDNTKSSMKGFFNRRLPKINISKCSFSHTLIGWEVINLFCGTVYITCRYS